MLGTVMLTTESAIQNRSRASKRNVQLLVGPLEVRVR